MIHCNKCDTDYDCYEGNYYENKINKTGYDWVCSECKINYMANWRNKFKTTKIWWDYIGIIESTPITTRQADIILKKISRYHKKLRWQQPVKYINDIKLCEL